MKYISSLYTLSYSIALDETTYHNPRNYFFSNASRDFPKRHVHRPASKQIMAMIF